MVAGEVSGDAADRRSFNAAFGAGGTCGTCDDQRQSGASNKRIHVSRTPLLYFSIRTLKFDSPLAQDPTLGVLYVSSIVLAVLNGRGARNQ
jgi:hypothetical protein